VKKSVEIKIMNQKFNLKTESDEAYVQRVSDYVNKKIFDVQEKTRSVSSLNVALLTALNIADDYFKMKGNKKDHRQEAKQKVEEIIQLIDHCMEQA
jgi:cell division protein ZapA